eukprot:SAG11_NODE_6724_length_1259_cov_1.399138_2_plen_61_part_00
MPSRQLLNSDSVARTQQRAAAAAAAAAADTAAVTALRAAPAAGTRHWQWGHVRCMYYYVT